MSSAEASVGAATFIRDLYYNPQLRDSYFTALRTIPQHRKAAVNKILEPYNCTVDDLGAGWATLEKQSFLAWQSVYRLKSLTSDTDSHTVTLVGSRTGKTTVMFDNSPIIGFTAIFLQNSSDTSILPTISWSTNSSSGTSNVFIQLDHTTPSTDPGGTIGDRMMTAKIWGPNESEPTDFTHSGLDFFSDMGMFNGIYNTLITDPDSGDQTDGFPASVKVNFTSPTDGSTPVATVDLTVTDDNRVELSVGQSLSTDRDEIQWVATDNASTPWPEDANVQRWRNGYLTFSWEYIPPKQSPSGITDAKLTQRFNGSFWLDDMNNSAQVDGDIQPDSIPPDVDATLAKVVGYTTSIALFLLLAVGIFKSLKRFCEWVYDKMKVDEKIISGEEPTEKELTNEKASDQATSVADEIVQIPESAAVVDPSDPSTFERKLNQEGEPKVSYRGEAVYKNPVDPNTTLADIHVDGEPSPGKEVTDLDGQQIKNVEDMPTLSSPIENTETGQMMMMKEIGKQWTHSITIDWQEAQRVVTGEGKDLKNFEPEEITHL